MSARVAIPGLAPSEVLAPSESLAPADTTYAGGPITPHTFAAALGTGGTYVDITAWIEYGEGVTYRYGRDTQFDDFQPGTFTFTLNNADGRFTPDNPYSPLPTRMTEGVGVVWQLGTRLVHGTVLSVEIPANDEAWDQLVVTCDDMLGAAGRHMLTNLPDAAWQHAAGDLMWRLDEDADAAASVEAGGDGLGAFTFQPSNLSSRTAAVTLGVDAVAGLPGSAVTLTAGPGEYTWYGTRYGNQAYVSHVTTPALTTGQSGTYGYWSMWVYPASTIILSVIPGFAGNTGTVYAMQIICTPTSIGVRGGTGAITTTPLTSAQQLAPHFVSMAGIVAWQATSSTWQLTINLYLDGALIGSTTWSDPIRGTSIPATTVNFMSPVQVGVYTQNQGVAGSPNVTGTVQRVSHTVTLPNEQQALTSTLNGRRVFLDQIADEIATTTTLPGLNAAATGYADVDNTSILDQFNDIIRSEAGHLYCQTTGSTTAPTETVVFRPRDRPATPKAVFDVTQDGSGYPAFVRDITNVVASLEVTGPTQNIIVTDATVTGRYVTSGNSETVLYTAVEDLREWGQDRLYRGRNVAVRARTVTIDAVTTPTDRSADLLGLVPGDRIQLANTPRTRLGFGSWDGWIVGATESHGVDQDTFTFTLAPTLATAGSYDTALYASGGDVTLTSAVTATATSWAVAIRSGAAMSTAVPYTLAVDSEQVTVTAVSGTTITVTRAQNGTTAAAHTAGSAVEVIPTAIYGY